MAPSSSFSRASKAPAGGDHFGFLGRAHLQLVVAHVLGVRLVHRAVGALDPHLDRDLGLLADRQLDLLGEPGLQDVAQEGQRALLPDHLALRVLDAVDLDLGRELRLQLGQATLRLRAQVEAQILGIGLVEQHHELDRHRRALRGAQQGDRLAHQRREELGVGERLRAGLDRRGRPFLLALLQCLAAASSFGAEQRRRRRYDADSTSWRPAKAILRKWSAAFERRRFGKCLDFLAGLVERGRQASAARAAPARGH